MTKDNVWVVTAHRAIEMSEHSYVVGVYTDYGDAQIAANIEIYNRAGKYDMDINGYTLNKMPEDLSFKLGED